MGERNEKEHKELIKTANDGVKAINQLTKKYGDLTKVKYYELEEDLKNHFSGDLELEFKEK